jgi:polysaccharide deacetylase 2 family uncharacterized protein YibQ
MAPLNNFGAIFTFAIQMESQIRDYFQQLGMADRAKESGKRLEKLERARREYIVEITLEPIDDLESDTYTLNLNDTSPEGQRAVAAVARQFYADAAPKVNVRQAQRILEKCGSQYA